MQASAPSFRAKKREPVNPVKSPSAQPPGSPMGGSQRPPQPARQNMGGGPRPMEQPPASKTTSMMAPGRPNNSRMYADGGFGEVPPFGAEAPPPPAGTPGAAPPSPMGDIPPVRPEAVAYHDDPQACGGANGGAPCSYFMGGQCQLLQIEVTPVGGCAAYMAGEGEMPGEPAEEMAPVVTDDDGNGY